MVADERCSPLQGSAVERGVEGAAPYTRMQSAKRKTQNECVAGATDETARPANPHVIASTEGAWGAMGAPPGADEAT